MATVYVSPAGSDSYTYVQAQSSSTPWQTIGKCNTSATAGDTIICLAGTHTFAAVAFTKSFTISGETGVPSDVIFSGSGLALGDVVTGIWGTATVGVYLTISGIRFTNFDTAAANGGRGPGIFTAGAQNSSISLSKVIIDDVDFTSFAAGEGGIVGTSNSSATGIAVSVINSAFYNMRTSASSPQLFSCRTATTATFTYTGNTFHIAAASGWTGAVIVPSNGTHTWKNNIFYDGANVFSAANIDTATYSCFYNLLTGKSGTGNITSDPLFVDAANSNFNLRPASPCIGTGSV